MEDNKVGVIFGASSGVGAACIERMKNFKKVYAISRRGKVLNDKQIETDLPENILSIKCDVRDYKSVEYLLLNIEEDIDFIVSCVGVGFYAPIDNDYSSKWKDIFYTNVIGNVNILSNLVRHHNECKTAIVLGSVAAKRPSMTPGNEIYRASKVALETFLNDFRSNIRSKNNFMKVCNLQPGFIEGTDFGRNFFEKNSDENIDLYSSFTNLSPDDIAKTINTILSVDDNIDIGEIVIRPTEQPT